MTAIDFTLAPPDATLAGAHGTLSTSRCWNCAYYSFKVYGGDDSTQGKCFRDSGRTWWVDGLMICPSYKPDEDLEQ